MAPPPPRPTLLLRAGLSRLPAAPPLPAPGHPGILAEARDRLGGRIHTQNRIDLGAHWIHGTEGNPLTVLARQLGLPTMFVGGDSSYTGGWEDLALRDAAGKPISAQKKLESILAIDEIR